MSKAIKTTPTEVQAKREAEYKAKVEEFRRAKARANHVKFVNKDTEVKVKGTGESKVSVRIDDTKPVITLGMANGPYEGYMKIADVIKELRIDGEREIINPKTGVKYDLARLEKFFVVAVPKAPVKDTPKEVTKEAPKEEYKKQHKK